MTFDDLHGAVLDGMARLQSIGSSHAQLTKENKALMAANAPLRSELEQCRDKIRGMEKRLTESAGANLKLKKALDEAIDRARKAEAFARPLVDATSG